jgi:uncharacterized membrane protein YkvA (DUF1232 family)
MKRGSLKRWAALLKGELLTVFYAARDPEAPWLARLVAIAVAAYALSPIDLIPDFIPVLGLLDDLILVPLGFWLVLRLMPPAVIARARQRAAEQLAAQPQGGRRDRGGVGAAAGAGRHVAGGPLRRRARRDRLSSPQSGPRPFFASVSATHSMKTRMRAET